MSFLRPFCVFSASRLRLFCVFSASFLLFSGCAYYNTFYNAQTLYRDGVKMVEANNKTAARDKFEKAIKKSAAVIKNWPKSEWVDDALLLAAMSYYQEGEYTKAIVKFENFAAAFPESQFRDQARLYHALSLIGDEQYVKGIQMLTDLADTSASGGRRSAVGGRRSAVAVEAAYQLAVTALKRNEYADAITALQAFMTRYPHDPKCTDAGQLRAEALFHEGQYLPAIHAYAEHRRLTQRSRDRTLDDLQIAECYLRLNQSDSVLAILQRQADKFPEYNDRINLLAGKAFLSKGKPNEAVASLTKVRNGTEGAEACLLLGRNCEQDTARTTQHLADASAWYDSAKARDPSSTFAQQAAQRSLLITRLIQLTKGTTDTAEARFLLAEIYHLNMEQDSQALVLYQKVADSFPKSPYAPKALYAIAWIKQQQEMMNSDSGLHPSSLTPILVVDSQNSKLPSPESVSPSPAPVPRPPTLDTSLPSLVPHPSPPAPPSLTARQDYLLAYQDVVDRYPKTIYAQEARKTLGLPLLPDWEIEKPPPPKVDTSQKIGGLANDSLLAKRGPGDTLNKSGYPRPDTGKVPAPVAERPGRRESARERHGKTPSPGGETPPSTPPPSPSTISGKNGGESHSNPGTKPPTPNTQHPTPSPQTPAPVTPPPGLPAVGPESLPRPDTGKTQAAGAKQPAGNGKPSADSIAPRLAGASPTSDTAKAKVPSSKPSELAPHPAPPAPSPDTALKPVYFAFDRSTLRARDTLILRANLDQLLKTPDVAIQISGYCDPRGSDEYNDELGLRRAEAVKQWLVAHGVGADRIRTNSYGSSLVTTDDPAFYWQERRSEIRIRAP